MKKIINIKNYESMYKLSEMLTNSSITMDDINSAITKYVQNDLMFIEMVNKHMNMFMIYDDFKIGIYFTIVIMLLDWHRDPIEGFNNLSLMIIELSIYEDIKELNKLYKTSFVTLFNLRNQDFILKECNGITPC